MSKITQKMIDSIIPCQSCTDQHHCGCAKIIKATKHDFFVKCTCGMKWTQEAEN